MNLKIKSKLTTMNIIWLVFILTMVVAFIIGSFKDLSIANYAKNLNQEYGKSLSNLGLITSFFPIFLAIQFILMFIAIKWNRILFKRLIFLVDFLAIMVCAIALFDKDFKNFSFEWNKLIWVTVTMIIFLGSHYLICKNYIFFEQHQTIIFDAIFVIVFVIMISSMTTILKITFNRPRPRDVINNGINFRSWWVIKYGHNESYRSFPSGHSTSAISLIGICPLIKNKKWKASTFLLFVIIYFMIAFSRMIVKAHFLTDVTAAGIISVGQYLILTMIKNKVQIRYEINQKVSQN